MKTFPIDAFGIEVTRHDVSDDNLCSGCVGDTNDELCKALPMCENLATMQSYIFKEAA